MIFDTLSFPTYVEVVKKVQYRPPNCACLHHRPWFTKYVTIWRKIFLSLS